MLGCLLLRAKVDENFWNLKQSGRAPGNRDTCNVTEAKIWASPKMCGELGRAAGGKVLPQRKSEHMQGMKRCFGREETLCANVRPLGWLRYPIC